MIIPDYTGQGARISKREQKYVWYGKSNFTVLPGGLAKNSQSYPLIRAPRFIIESACNQPSSLYKCRLIVH